MRYIRGFLIKKAPILWLRNRTTENRKGKKARNIKEKRQSKNFNTVSKQLVVLHSSPNVNHTFQNVQFQTVFYNPSKDFFGRVFCDFMKILNTTVKQKFIIKLDF
mgnify:CR=1 FL=1